jgi:hypothetical protein
MHANRWISMSAAALATAACASVPVNSADADTRGACDANRMAQVERDARRTFKEVHWLHCPQAAVPAM